MLNDIKLTWLHKSYNSRHKYYDDIHYVTNGNDYYFTNAVDIKLASFIIIVDYFNGKQKHDGLASEFSSEICEMAHDIDDPNDIHLMLMKYDDKNKLITGEFYLKSNFDIRAIKGGKLGTPGNSDSEGEHCCDYHCDYDFEPENCKDIVRVYNSIYDDIKTDFSVIIMDRQLYLNLNDIVVEKNKIYFRNTGYFSRINFASCWNNEFGPEDYIKTTKTRIEYYGLPYINYNRTPLGYQFSIDMFNNDFIHSENETIRLPTDLKDNPSRNRSDSSEDDEDEDEDEDESDNEDEDEDKPLHLFILNDEDNEDDCNKYDDENEDNGGDDKDDDIDIDTTWILGSC